MPDIKQRDTDEIDVTFRPAPSSKGVALRQAIEKIPPGSKIIVVSSFVKLLELVRPYLEHAGIKTVMYTAKDSIRKRARALESFKKDEKIQCLLMSIKAGRTGLNLTEANHMIIMDLAWNPATEQQALGRIHRIGQEKEVHCTRLIVQDSVEARLKDLQSGKQRMSDETLGVAGGFKLDFKKLDRTQLRYLFGLDASGRRIVNEKTL